MSYSVKEIFYSLQGEGARSGRPSVFCRFSGCNLWSGREDDRATAQCSFCDTDFVGTDGELGGRYRTPLELSSTLRNVWDRHTVTPGRPYLVFTGGEPMLQLTPELVQEVKQAGFEVAIETNGTIKVTEGVDWITVSPKPLSTLVQTSGQELKLVYPQAIQPQDVEHLDFENFYLSPMDSGDEKENKQNLESAAEFCLQHPKWSLSIQLHKLLGLP